LVRHHCCELSMQLFAFGLATVRNVMHNYVIVDEFITCEFVTWQLSIVGVVIYGIGQYSIQKNLLKANIWDFIYFVCGLSPPKRRVVRWRNFAHGRVTTICRTCAGFMSIGVVVTKIMTLFQKCVQVGVHFCSGLLPIPAGWLAAAAGCLAACWAGVSQPSSLSLNQAVAAHLYRPTSVAV